MNEYQVSLRDSKPGPTGLTAVAASFRRAFVSQLHPRMLFAVLLPFVITLLGAILLLWIFWDPLTDWLTVRSESWGVFNTFHGWLFAIGLFSIKLYLIPLLAAALRRDGQPVGKRIPKDP